MYLHRTYIGGVYCEIGISENPVATLVFLPGLPGYPKHQELMKQFICEGYNVIYPRYCGSFESDGLFLQKSPSEDVLGVLAVLKKKKSFKELYGLKLVKINLGKLVFLGNSFGGSVAADLCSRVPNSSAVVMCPVDDFKDLGRYNGERTVAQIASFIKRGFRHIYRCDARGFEKLGNNLLIRPLLGVLPRCRGRLVLFHGRDDKTVNPQRSIALAEKCSIKLYLVRSEHISLNSIPFRKLLREINALIGRKRIL